MKKIIITSIITVAAGLVIFATNFVLADPSQDVDERKCIALMHMCFAPDDYEVFIDGLGGTSPFDCAVMCAVNDLGPACDQDTCFEMCLVASGNSLNACPLPGQGVL